MANWTDQTKIDKLFKALMNKARTSPGKQFYEENIPTTFDLHASEIYAETIPTEVPDVDTAVVKVYGPANRVILTRDRTVDAGTAWVALEPWSDSWSSGAGDITKIKKNFISPKYGTDYVVKVFKGDDTRISELDNVSWIFDYKAGVLVFETSPEQSGNSVTESIQIEVCQYIGKTVDMGVGTGDPSGSGDDGQQIIVTNDPDGETRFILDENNQITELQQVTINRNTYIVKFEHQPQGTKSNLIDQVHFLVTLDENTMITNHFDYVDIIINGKQRSMVSKTYKQTADRPADMTDEEIIEMLKSEQYYNN